MKKGKFGMKRKGNLYQNIYNINNILNAYNEVCKNTKNKRKVNNYRQYKCIYISRVYDILKNKQYEVGPYNVFYIDDPKRRRIVSQGIQDKIINHLVSREILYEQEKDYDYIQNFKKNVT